MDCAIQHTSKGVISDAYIFRCSATEPDAEIPPEFRPKKLQTTELNDRRLI